MAFLYADNSHWHKRAMTATPLFDSNEIYKRVMQLFAAAPQGKPIHTLSVSCYGLVREPLQQLSLLEDVQKKRALTNALDAINERWGDFTITPAVMMGMEDTILDRVAYGGVKELEEFVNQEE